jgi:hypothetical protein
MYYFGKTQLLPTGGFERGALPMLTFRRHVSVALRTARGGVRARILMAAGTLVVAGILIVVLLNKNEADERYHYENALTIAEYGWGEALMRLREEPSWSEGFKDVNYKDGSYTVTLTKEQPKDTVLLKVESVGRSGSVERSKSIVLCLQVGPEGDSLWRQHSTR